MVKRQTRKTITEEITRIRVLARTDYPYLYGLVQGVSIKMIEGKEKAYTDGRYVYMTEDLIRNRASNNFIYCHELLHIGLLHVERMKFLRVEKNMKIYNILADHRVNMLLSEKLRIPEGAIRSLEHFGFEDYLTEDEMRDYNKYSVDYLYNKLVKQGVEPPEDYELDIVPDDSGEKGEDKGDSGSSLTEAEVRELMRKGQVYARSIGAEKGLLGEMIENMCNKYVKWDKIIINNTHSLFEKRQDWSRIHRKSYFDEYPVLPRQKRKDGVKILVGVDTSGSMDMSDISKFMGSLIKLVRTYNAELEIMEVDCERQKIFTVKSVRDLERVEIKGRGGTSFKPFISYIGERKADLAVLSGNL